MRKPEDFERFYYTKVGLGEGCGCAERVIDMHEWERRATEGGLRDPDRPGLMARIWRRISPRSRSAPDQG